MRRYAPALLSFLAGFLLFQSVQATDIDVPPPLVDAGMGLKLSAPTGTFNESRVGGGTENIATLFAHDGGKITGTGDLTLNLVQGGPENRMLRATGPDSLIDMTAGKTVINLPTAAIQTRNRGAMADTGGMVILKNVTVSFGNTPPPTSRALEADAATLSATDTTVVITDHDIGAYAFGSGKLSLTGTSTVTLNGSNSWGIITENDPGDDVVTTLTATDTMISVTGDHNQFVAALRAGTITTINNCIVTGSGSGNFGLFAIEGGEINVLNHSTVTSKGSNSSAALVDSGSVLNVDGSTIHGDANGIVITNDILTLRPDTVTLTGKSTLTNLAGDNGEAAFQVVGADVNIAVTDSTVDSGTGATQHTLLEVSQTVTQIGDQPPVVHPSVVDLTADNSNLNGDILVDATSKANVKLEHNSILTGAVNENQLTGATGINPTEQVTHPISPGLPPQTVDLGIDSTSTWNMRASSTLNTLTVSPQAHINFADPPTGAFKTLLVNNLIGTGGIFGMNVDLGLIKGDLIEILTKSEGEHLLTFVNRNQGSDLPVNTALLVVRTPDGGAGFTGETDGGTFKYFVVHGNGSPVTPIKNDWYLVRGDEIKPPQVTPPPPTNPKPTPPEFVPGDVLPLPPEILPAPLSPAADLTNTANAAIGTYSSTIPLFYADMQTLVERMGELRLGIEAAPAPVPPSPPEVGKGVVESKQIVAPPAPPPRNEWGVWIRGFGNGMRINNDVSRTFDQNVGGFQIGADRRFGSLWSGDVYLGVFGSYFYASRDFRDGGDGSTNAFSLGG